ncbi:MotA/TolQ/ExbB proton channel family protein [Magnetospirillum fulvum]|uniref:MotA/TolQ/ExbB proton channel domain-containing protein n=1 Tax=Magnetospirillum fulvum MGU-K5 TaxID=1316936 RepID=S9SAH6_MAGFU|nr:MotA/TolQ/ExbB proton channel family protein [Magnetospirillum fulvum]EPY01694.1 hypothetical protein K678_09585 [Magnetospirillum fulvum MGU-K5]
MAFHLEDLLYGASQLFQIPVLVAVVALFLYAFYAVGGFLWQMRQRRQDDPAGFDLIETWRGNRHMNAVELETLAFRRLESARIVSRVAPMLGLVATMIPMGPALKSLADGNFAAVGGNLTVAFSAVILSLVAASLAYWVVNVRRRWYAEDMIAIDRLRPCPDAAILSSRAVDAVLTMEAAQ